jgi:hypothetical protein
MAVLGGLTLCLSEILLGLGLVYSRLVQWAALALLLMMVGFTVWSGWNYLQGRIEDCRCFGDVLPRATDPWLIVENILICVLLTTVFLSHVRRGDTLAGALAPDRQSL